MHGVKLHAGGVRRFNVLLVDDDSLILRSLERLLRRCGPSVDVAVASGGAEALAEIRSAGYDAIITDIEMPGMSGTELLERIQHSHPEMIRVHLSGNRSVGTAYRAVPLAHQFLVKPVQGQHLLGVVGQLQSLQSLFHDSAIRSLIGRSDTLPALPLIYEELGRCLAEPTCSFRDIADVIQQDIGISAAVMKVATSSFFVRQCAASSVEEAVRAFRRGESVE